VSEPIVQFRETVILPPKMDMVNEAIVESNKVINKYPMGLNKEIKLLLTRLACIKNKNSTLICSLKVKTANRCHIWFALFCSKMSKSLFFLFICSNIFLKKLMPKQGFYFNYLDGRKSSLDFLFSVTLNMILLIAD
jgi:hypothetical protein